MTMPKRIQRRRVKGWRMPANCINVTRPGVFGNPFTLKNLIECGYSQNDREKDRAFLVQCFRDWITHNGSSEYWSGPTSDEAYRKIMERIGELRGKDLACFCPLTGPCHADVLLEIANR